MADNRPGGGGGDDEEIGIPRAALNKMIKEILPSTRIANDARDLISNCCTEFIHLIASEANDICNKQNKKTISPEHILTGEEVQKTVKSAASSSIPWTFPFRCQEI